MDKPGISVIGLGKLGICIAGVCARKGFQTIGVDISERTIDLVNHGLAPVVEPGLEKLLGESQGMLRATDDYDDAICHSDVTFVIIPTDSNAEGAFSIKLLRDAAVKIGESLANKDGYHLVVVTSTVLPGSCEFGIVPIIEEASSKKCGEGFGLCYSPEFIALGSVINDFLNPDFSLVGVWDERSGDILESVYMELFENDSPVVRMSLANAELTKISLNAYITTKITFANLLAEICEHLPGGDVDVVTRALGLDKRIGSSYFKGALGYGGTCFPRDNAAFSYLMNYLGVDSALAQTVDRLNRRNADRLTKIVMERLREGETVAVLGLSFKPDTPVVVESQGLKIARILAMNGIDVVTFDPVAMEEARVELGDTVTYASSVEECLENASIAVIATAWEDFEDLPLKKEADMTIIDGWRILNSPGANYVAIGREISTGSEENVLSNLVERVIEGG